MRISEGLTIEILGAFFRYFARFLVIRPCLRRIDVSFYMKQRVVRSISKDIFKLLKETTWPTRKESWLDFKSIMEYTAFFVVMIYIFDQLIISGLIRFINIF